MEQLIIHKKRNIFKIIAGVLVALWTVNPFYLLHFNWLIWFKGTMLLWFFGVREFYYFDSNNSQLKVTTFLKYPILKRNITKVFPENISIYKRTSSSYYELYLYANRKKSAILNTKKYSELCLKANQISSLLGIEFYNPYESYD